MRLLLWRRRTAAGEPIPAGSRAVQVGNSATATAALVIGSITLEQDGTAFAIVDDSASGQSLQPGQSRRVVVSFTPTEAGTQEATLRIPSTDPDGVTEVTFNGTGFVAPAPVVSVDPASWAAGSAATGSGSPYVDVSVSNTGNAPLTVGTVALAGSSFTKTSDAASGQVIAPGASAAVRVTFTPSTTGAKTGTLTVPSDGGADVVVALTGTGTKALSVSPTSWNAGSVTVTGGSSTLTATVRSTGTVPVTAGTLAVTGTGFAKGTDNVSSQVLDPAETATVAVVFDPSSAGAKTGNLAVPSDATAGTVNVALSGNGTEVVVVPPPPPPPPPAETISVSRMYLGWQSNPILIPAGSLNGWYFVTEDIPHAMTVVKGGPPTAYAPIVNARAGLRSLHGRWVGPRMAAQTINTTFTCTLPEAWASKYLNGKVTSALQFIHWRAATNTLIAGPILHHATVVDSWKEIADALPRRFPGGVPQSWTVKPQPMVLAEGDRIIVQVGCYVVGDTGPTAPTRIRYGGSSTQADAGTIISPTPDAAGWIEFTIPLLVLA